MSNRTIDGGLPVATYADIVVVQEDDSLRLVEYDDDRRDRIRLASRYQGRNIPSGGIVHSRFRNHISGLSISAS